MEGKNSNWPVSERRKRTVHDRARRDGNHQDEGGNYNDWSTFRALNDQNANVDYENDCQIDDEGAF